MPEVRFFVPPSRSASTALAVGTAVASFWSIAWGSGHELSLQPRAVLEHGHAWQLLTWVLVAPPTALSVLFDALIIWLTGWGLEERWGRKRYLRFLLVVVSLSAVLTLLVSLVSSEVSGSAFYGAQVMSGVVWVGYGCSIWGRQTNLFGFAITGKVFALLAVVLVVVNGVLGGLATVLAELLAMAMTFAYVLYGWPTQPWLRLRSRQLERDLKRRASHLRSVDGGRDKKDYLN